MGANQIYEDRLGFSSLAKEKELSNKRFGSITETESEKLKKHIQEVLPQLSFHEIKDILSVIYRIKKKRFRGNMPPKYGSLNKGFTKQEVQMFFRVIDNLKLRLLFSYQAQLGLRVGEAVRLNIKDIDFQTRELTIKSEKSNTLDTLIIPIPLFRLTLEYLKQNNKQIETSMGYLFFKEDGYYSERNQQYLSKDYIRNRFRHYVQKAGLDRIYDSSDETNYDRVLRSLHRLTTHSLRHYAITSFSKQTNGNIILTAKFARHRATGVTLTYISTTKQELYKEIDKAFSLEQAELLKRKIST